MKARRMHVVTKFKSWYESQNDTTKAWLDKQAVWHDRDMWISFVIGILFGIMIGLAI